MSSDLIYKIAANMDLHPIRNTSFDKICKLNNEYCIATNTHINNEELYSIFTVEQYINFVNKKV